MKKQNLPLDLYDRQLLFQPKTSRDAPGEYKYQLLYFPGSDSSVVDIIDILTINVATDQQYQEDTDECEGIANDISRRFRYGWCYEESTKCREMCTKCESEDDFLTLWVSFSPLCLEDSYYRKNEYTYIPESDFMKLCRAALNGWDPKTDARPWYAHENCDIEYDICDKKDEHFDAVTCCEDFYNSWVSKDGTVSYKDVRSPAALCPQC